PLDPTKHRVRHYKFVITLTYIHDAIIHIYTLPPNNTLPIFSFKDRANDAAAKANVRAAIPAVEAYNSDNTGTGNSAGYAGMTLAGLQTYDAGLRHDFLGTATSVT